MKKYLLENKDCLDHSIPREYSKIKLIYCDPPYGSKKEDKYYGVGETDKDFILWLEKRLKILVDVLSEDSNLVLHMDYKNIYEAKCIVDKYIGKENFMGDIIWCYSSPSIAKKHLPRKHDILLRWKKGKNPPYNAEYIPYNGLGTAKGSSWGGIDNKKRSDMLQRGKLLEDWWTDIPSLCRNEGEKTGWKTQKPLRLMERIVKMFSNEKDIVYDPMCGSGTFLEAAIKNNRFPIGCDVSKEAIKICQKRIDN